MKAEKTEKIGYRFIEARKKAKKSQTEIAKDLDVTKQTVRNWEHDRARCDKHSNLEYYSKISGFPISYLTGSELSVVEDFFDILANDMTNSYNVIRDYLIPCYVDLKQSDSRIILRKWYKKTACTDCEISQDDLRKMVHQLDQIVRLYLDQYFENHNDNSLT